MSTANINLFLRAAKFWPHPHASLRSTEAIMRHLGYRSWYVFLKNELVDMGQHPALDPIMAAHRPAQEFLRR